MSTAPAKSELETLQGQRKTLLAIVGTLAVIIVVMGGYSIYRVATIGWDDRSPVLVTGLMGPLVITMFLATRIGALQAAIKGLEAEKSSASVDAA